MNPVINQMQRDFARMLEQEIPGQNWDCTLISCYGNGIDNIRRHGEPARCVCYDKGGRSGKPTFRTSLNDPIKMGMLVWIREQNTHYLLTQRPQKDVNCYSTQATPCTHELTFTQETPREVDDDGHVLYPGGKEDVLRDLPCVVVHGQQITLAQGTPGLVVDDTLTIKTQYNINTAAIDVGAEAVIDHQTYKVMDMITDGAEGECGLLTLIMERVAGGRQ